MSRVQLATAGVKPPFAYYGGKVRLASWIINHMPAHRVYLEPFFGSGAVFFAKSPAVHEVINDLDATVVTFFRVLREQPEELERVCRLTPYARDEWALCRDVREPGLPDLERARRFWVRVTQSFAAAVGSRGGWSISTEQNTRPPSTVQARIDRFHKVAARLATVSIENVPAIDLIERLATADTFIYVDPPYMDSVRRGSRGSRSSDYGHDMGDLEDHKELARVLLATPAAVILSGYPSDLYQDLYAGWWSADIEVNSQSVNRRSGSALARTERIWSNRDLEAGRLPLWG